MVMKNNYSYLPGCGTVDAAQNKAVKGILEWAGAHLPEHRADADEQPDQTESAGFSTVMHDIVAEPTTCLGFTCPMSSATCDICKLSKEDVGIENPHVSFEVFAEINRILPMRSVELEPPIDSVFQSWQDARHELYLSAPMERGRRAHL